MAEHHSQTPAAVIRKSSGRRTTGAFVLAGLSGSHGVFHWFTESFLVMLPEVKATFGLSPVQVGSIMTIRQVASGVVTLPGGVLADMLHRYWGLVLAVCMAGFGVGGLVMGTSPVFPLLLVGMAIVSAASSLWHLPAMASLSQHFSHRRGTALAIHGIGGNIGEVAGPVATGFLLGILAWRGVLTIYAVAPLFLAFAVFWAFRDIGKTEEGEVLERTAREQVQLTRRVFKNTALWGINLAGGLRSMARIAFITFLPLYLKDELGLSSAGVGFYVGLLALVGVVATPAMGYLSDRLGRKLVLVPGLIFLATLSWLLVVFGDGAGLAVIIALLGLFLYSDQPILTAAALDIVGHDVATTTLGVLSFSRFALSAVSPLIAGFLYQAWGIDSTFQYVAVLFALAAVILMFTRLKPPHRALHDQHLGRHSHS